MGAFLHRNGLVAAVFLAVPILFVVISSIMGGRGPDAKCPLCAVPLDLPELDPSLTGDDRTAQRVARWTEYVEGVAPTLTAEPLRFAWEEAAPPDRNDKPAEDLSIATGDLSARYAFAVPAVILILAALPIVISAMMVLRKADRAWRWCAAVVALAAVVGGIGFQDTNPVRLFVAKYLIAKAAIDPGYTYITPDVWILAFWTADTATVAGLLAAGQLTVVLAWLARRSFPSDTQAARRALIGRAKIFKTTLILGSLVLILAVATAHGLMHWSSSLLAPESAKQVNALASAASLYWGLMYSLALLALSLPSALALHLNLGDLADGTDHARDDLIGEAGIAVDLRHTLTALSTIAAPAITGPLLELVKAVSA